MWTASSWRGTWGTPPHGRLQTRIAAYLFPREQQWQIQVIVETRLKIRARKYRVPDLMVLGADAPRPELVIEQAPLLCGEIVSPKDRLSDLVLRAGEYFELGVPVTWILDLREKASWIYSRHETVEFSGPLLRHGNIELPIAELFGQV